MGPMMGLPSTISSTCSGVPVASQVVGSISLCEDVRVEVREERNNGEERTEQRPCNGD